MSEVTLPGQPSNTGTEPTPPTETPPSGTAPAKPYSTVEEAETFWQNRMSGKDRAHNAAEQALREQLAVAQAATASTAAGQSGTGATDDPQVKALREQNAQLTREREELNRQAAVATKKAKFPNLVSAGMDDSVFNADDASLAKLNAMLDDAASGGTFIAPTSPRKPTVTPPKPINEMSKEELEDLLKRSVDAGAHRPQGR